MIYNKELKRTINCIDCMSCRCYNKRKLRCEGLGIICFEIDKKTGIIIDYKTGFPVSKKELEKWK